VAKDILFDPAQGYAYIRFSLRRWFWSKVLDLVVKISSLETWLWGVAYKRSGLDVLQLLNGEVPDDCFTDDEMIAASERVVFLLPVPDPKDEEASRGA
jgi:hypothetical protein